jgi:phage protein D
VEKVKRPTLRVVFNGVDITKDITPLVLRAEYTDHVGGADDEIEIECINDGRWWGSWYPEKGTSVKVWIGYEGEPLLPCGSFEIDEISFDGPPDRVTIRGISSSIRKQMRTKKTRAWENTSLSHIVRTIANEYGGRVIWDGEDITFKRIDQKNETDLAFLQRLAKDYGFNFKVAGETLVFIKAKKLESLHPITTIYREQCLSYSIEDKAHKVYKGAEVIYFDPKENRKKSYKFELQNVPVGDYLRVETKNENLQQAIEKAKSKLRRKNKGERTVSLTMTGNTKLVAGLVVELKNFGIYDGRYLIEKSHHRISPSEGYKTSLEVSLCLNY